MKIGVDCHSLAGKFQGTKTYLANLYRSILMQDDLNKYVFFGHWDGDAPFGNGVEYEEFRTKSRVSRLLYGTAPLVKKNKLNAYHSIYISPIILGCKSIVTIHDLLFETHSSYFTKTEVLRNRLLIKRSAQHAVQVHTISEYSKEALIQIYGIDEKKIKVVPPGVDLQHFNPGNTETAKSNIELAFGISDYILTVGRIEPRKNHIGLLKAYAAVKSVYSDVGPLVIVGQKDFGYDKFFELVNQFGFSDNVKIYGNVDDSQLPDLYRAASVFVYPSYAEGFGIPPVEAMACGVPVISSNGSALAEVIGDGGMLVQPGDTDELSSAMIKVLSNDDTRNMLVSKGLRRANHWTWQRGASAYLDAIREI